MENGVADDAETKMPRLDDAGVNGTDGHLANPVPLHFEKAVAAFGRCPGHMRGIVDHGMNIFRPILVEQQRTRVRVPDALDAVLVMKFAFVPGGRRRDWSCRSNGSGDWRTEHAVFTAIHVDEVVNVAYVVVIGAAKYGDQTRGRNAQEIQRSSSTRLAVGKGSDHGCNTAIAPRKTAAKAAGICKPNTTRHRAQTPMTVTSDARKVVGTRTSSGLPMSMGWKWWSSAPKTTEIAASMSTAMK